MKKIVLILFVLVIATTVVIAQSSQNYCATAKCMSCGAIEEFTVGAATAAEAERTARLWLSHNSGCKARDGGRIRTRSAIGACPIIFEKADNE